MSKIKSLALASLFTISMSVNAEMITLDHYQIAGPIPITPHVTLGDTSGLESSFDPLKLALDINSLDFASVKPNEINAPEKTSLVVLSSKIENRNFCPVEISVEGSDNYVLYLDGKEIKGGKVKLTPATHRLDLKCLYGGEYKSLPMINISTDGGDIVVVDDAKRMFTLEDVLYGTRIDRAEISPSGNYLIVSYSDISDGGKSKTYQRLYDVKRSKFINTLHESAHWMPKSEKYYVLRNDYEHNRHIVTIDPSTGEESIFIANLPDGDFMISPTEDYLLFSLVREGAKEDKEIYRIIEPEDRQPGWRDRHYQAILYVNGNNALQPLLITKDNVETLDISSDGSKVLLKISSRRMTQRPTTLYTIAALDIKTMQMDTIVDRDGFIETACFSPDASKIAVMGSPEAFNRVGCVVADDVVPNIYDHQIFIIDVKDKSVTAITRDFDPSINSLSWSKYDGKIYADVTERDMYNLYSLDPTKDDVSMLNVPENVVKGFSVANSAPVLAVWGQSDSNPDAIYTVNLKSGKVTEVDHPSAQRLRDVKLGTCTDWTFDNSRGDKVYCRYYLPDNFDPNKKYPLIVNYYGGCNPSTRLFESRYPLHVYSSLGYIVLQIQPSGATGFGQEWSSRHVSTAGKGVAEDIIEGTKAFCQEMPFVDSDKIGCIGASYGGFMTQYLQTQTDIFKAAISHAGISDHTSYWGEGYWGYSYSEVSMGNDKPWSNPDLYVKQSPLYNADKVNTPILFLHGDSDTNVPVGESIQMFTALKLLGKETALVQVAAQDHHIKDDSKRKKWQNTIFAWFAKYLQDDPRWWEELYPEQNL